MKTAPARILIADDDAAIIDSTCMILEYMGYQVTSTLDGSDVLSMAQHSPALVILDVWLAGIDGRDICRSLKADLKTAGIPVLMISAGKDIKESVLASGADSFLEKPFEIEALLSKIAELTS